MLEKMLNGFGLNKNEIKIYLTLLSSGQSQVGALAKRTNIGRSLVQYICKNLVSKNIITNIKKGNGFIYYAEDPDKLFNLINKEKQKINEKEELLNLNIGELKNIFNPNTKLPKAKFFEGIEGLKAMFDNVFNHLDEPLYGALSIHENIHPEIIKYFNDEYLVKRAKTKQRAFFIFNENELSKQFAKNDKEVNRTSMFVDFDKFPLKSCFHIYGDCKVAFYSYDKNDLTGVIIENSMIYETMRSVFNLSWEYAKTLEVNVSNRNN